MKKKPLLLTCLALLAISLTGGFFLYKAKTTISRPVLPFKTYAVPAFSDWMPSRPDPLDLYAAPHYTNDARKALSKLPLSRDEKKALLAQGFIIRPTSYSTYHEFFSASRSQSTPSFISTDFIFHLYGQMMNDIIRDFSTDLLIPKLKSLSVAMLFSSLEYYYDLKDTPYKSAAKRNVAFFSVATQLLDPTVPIPQIVRKEVQYELHLIQSAKGIAKSPVMGIRPRQNALQRLTRQKPSLPYPKQNYTLYQIPESYAASAGLRQYYRAMTWYSQIRFRSTQEDEVRSILLMAMALKKPAVQTYWRQVAEPWQFIKGRTYDPTYYQIKGMADFLYQNELTLQKLTEDAEKFKAFQKGLLSYKSDSLFGFSNNGVRKNRYFRFISPDYSVSQALLDKLVFPNVSKNSAGQRRLSPSITDLSAVLGTYTSPTAPSFPHYKQIQTRLHSLVSQLPSTTWTQQLDLGWAYALKTLGSPKNAAYPPFMQSHAWGQLKLNTFFSGMIPLLSDSLSADSVTVHTPLTFQGATFYVEPQPLAYARLADIVMSFRQGLKDRYILNLPVNWRLQELYAYARYLESVSKKELEGTMMTHDEQDHMALFLESASKTGYLNRPTTTIATLYKSPYALLQGATGPVQEAWILVGQKRGTYTVARGGFIPFYPLNRTTYSQLNRKSWESMLMYASPKPLFPTLFKQP